MYRLIFLACCLLLLGAGCKNSTLPTPASSSSAARPAQAAGAKTRFVVVGADESNSYSYRLKLPDLLADFFGKNALPSDSWLVRRIGENSFVDKMNVPLVGVQSLVVLPAVEPAPNNPFNMKQAVRHKRSVDHFNRYKKQIKQSLSKLTIEAEKKTDIFGFLAKCADMKATDIVLFSDMVDTVGRHHQFNLSGARVWVVFFQSRSDAAKHQALQKQWDNKLRELGASQVTFIDPAIGVPILFSEEVKPK